METKVRIALLVPGGVGENDNIPALLDLLCRLGEYYDMSIYSFSKLAIHPGLAARTCTVTFAPALIEASSVLKSLYFLWRIRKDSVRKKFGLVHGFWAMPQGATAVLAGKLLGAPSIVSLLGGDVVYLPTIAYGSMKSFIHRIVVRWTVKTADRATVLTDYQSRVMKSNRISSASLFIIPFGADTAKFAFQSRDIAATPRFGFIGNLNRVKDPYMLISTFSLLARKLDCSLTVVGPDILSGRAQEYARSLGVHDRIQWMGKVPHELIPSLLNSFDFLLLTSRYEGEGVVVMEAFASGVLVAGTRVGLLADAGDESITVDPGDAEGLAEKILQLIREPARVHAMRVRNRQTSEEWRAERTSAEFRKLYEGLMQKKQ